MTDAPDSPLVASPGAGSAAVRGSVLQSGGYVVVFLLSLISAPLLIRHLGYVGFGRYTTVVALVTLVGGLTDAGMVNIALREWSTRSGEDRRATMRVVLGLRLELGVAGVAVGVLYALVVGFDRVMVIGVAVAGVGMLLQVISDFLSIALQGELQFGRPALISVSRQVIAVTLIVVLVLLGAGLLPFLAVTIPASFVALGLTALVVRGRIPLRPALRGPGRWALLRDTLPYTAAIAVNQVYLQVTILVMHQIADATQTGYFSVSLRVVQVLIGVPSLAIGAAFPILSHSARADSERFAQATGRILELALVVAVPVVLLLVLGAPFVVDVLVRRDGAPVVPVLRIQSLTLLATFLSTASGFALLSTHRHTALLIGNCGALTANIVLSFLLIPHLHAEGAAAAAALAELALAGGQLIFLLRAQPIALRLSTPLIALLGGGLGTCLLFVPVAIAPAPLAILRALAGLGIYLAVLVVTRRVPPELSHLRRTER